MSLVKLSENWMIKQVYTHSDNKNKLYIFYIKENRHYFLATSNNYDTLKLIFLKIPMNKIAHLVVC